REAAYPRSGPVEGVCGNREVPPGTSVCSVSQAETLRSAVEWRDGALEAIDQTLLPDRLELRRLTTVAETADAIRRLVVRGAPAIGIAGAFGVVLGLREGRDAA